MPPDSLYKDLDIKVVFTPEDDKDRLRAAEIEKSRTLDDYKNAAIHHADKGQFSRAIEIVKFALEMIGTDTLLEQWLQLWKGKKKRPDSASSKDIEEASAPKIMPV